MNRVAAVIINRDAREYLVECLASLAAQEYDGGITTWVVDNGSTDGSREAVLARHPDVGMVLNDRPTGYAKACNQGIALAREPYVIVMNSDTVLSTDTVAQVAGSLDADTDAAVVGPRILNTDGTVQFSCREFPSIGTAFMHAFVGLFRADNRYSTRYKKMEFDHATECEVDWVSGAFMGLRREAVEAIGGFDERYFMYVEDVDLCWRAKEAGYRVCFIPRGAVVHHVGMSSRFASTRMTLHHHRSMLRFHRRTYRGRCKPLVDAAVALGIAARFALIAALNALFRLRAAFGGKERVIMPGNQ